MPIQQALREGQVMIRSKAGNWFLIGVALLLPGSFVVLALLWLWRRSVTALASRAAGPSSMPANGNQPPKLNRILPERPPRAA